MLKASNTLFSQKNLMFGQQWLNAIVPALLKARTNKGYKNRSWGEVLEMGIKEGNLPEYWWRRELSSLVNENVYEPFPSTISFNNI